MESNDFRRGKGRPPLATCLRIKNSKKYYFSAVCIVENIVPKSLISKT